MAAGNFLELMMFLTLPLAGGNDLLDLISTEDYWTARGVAVGVDALVGELRLEAPPDVSALLAKLGDEKFIEREAAMKKLKALGPAILPQLEKAAEAKDAEIASRVRRLIQQFGQGRAQTAERRLMAIRTLGEIRAADAVKHLKPLVASKEPFVAEYAQRAIASIEGKSSSPKKPTAEQLDEDLWLLPAKCGVVGQLAMHNRIRLDFDALLKPPADDRLAIRDERSPSEKINSIILKLSEKIGNARVDAVTLGISEDIGQRAGFVVFILRGMYNKDAVKTAMQDQGDTRWETKNGVDVGTFGYGGRVLLVSNERLIFVAGPPAASPPIDDLLAAVKAGKGRLSSNEKMAALIKKVDRTKPLWLAARMTDAYRKEGLYKNLDTITLSAEQRDASLSGKLVAECASEEKADQSLAVLNTYLRASQREMETVSRQMPAMKAVHDFLMSVKSEKQSTGNTVLVTAEVKDCAALAMFPVSMLLLYGAF